MLDSLENVSSNDLFTELISRIPDKHAMCLFIDTYYEDGLERGKTAYRLHTGGVDKITYATTAQLEEDRP